MKRKGKERGGEKKRRKAHMYMKCYKVPKMQNIMNNQTDLSRTEVYANEYSGHLCSSNIFTAL